MPLLPGYDQSRQQHRDRFIGDILTITGDTRRLWTPKPTDTTTSLDESLNGATLTHGATLAGRLSALGLGYAASFNGTTDYSSFPDAADLSFNTAGVTDLPFSVVCLANITDTAGQRTLLSKFDNTTGNEWILDVLSTDKLRLLLADSSAAAFSIRTSDVAIAQGAPHLYVSTYSGVGGASAANGVVLYVDGLPVASTTTSVGGVYAAMENLAGVVEIGSIAVHTSSFFIGSQGLSLLCAKALTASEVWAIKKLVNAYFNLSL